MGLCVHCGQWVDTSPIHLHGATQGLTERHLLDFFVGVFPQVKGYVTVFP